MPASDASKVTQDSAARPKSWPGVMASWFAARKRNSQLYFEDWCSIRFLTSVRVNVREARTR